MKSVNDGLGKENERKNYTNRLYLFHYEYESNERNLMLREKKTIRNFHSIITNDRLIFSVSVKLCL